MLISIALATSIAAAQPEAPASPPGQAAAELPAPAAADAAYRELLDAALAVPQPLRPEDSESRIRIMARSDYDESRFFNRPGATRAEYEREWEQCRRIARRLATADSIPVQVTHVGAPPTLPNAVGGAIGGAIAQGFAAAFAERGARQEIRRHCLVTRGWRMVQPNEEHRRRIGRMSRQERTAYLDRMIGAAEVTDAEIHDLARIREKENAAGAGS